MRRLWIGLLAVAGSLVGQANAAPIWSLRLDTPPGSYFGAGQSYLLLNQTSPINVFYPFSNSPEPFGFDAINITQLASPFVQIEMITRLLGQPLTSGLYQNAPDQLFSGQAFFSIGFEGRKDDVTISDFQIDTLTYIDNSTPGLSNYTISSLSFGFAGVAPVGQNPGTTDDSFTGAFAYNAPLPPSLPPIPEPRVIWIEFTIIWLVVVVWRQRLTDKTGSLSSLCGQVEHGTHCRTTTLT